MQDRRELELRRRHCSSQADPAWVCRAELAFPASRAGPVTAVPSVCPAEQVTVGRWTPGLSADHEDVAAAPAPQRAQPKAHKVVTF